MITEQRGMNRTESHRRVASEMWGNPLPISTLLAQSAENEGLILTTVAY
jgi:hypothetical protein